jgi:CheY-like chemotaxis protein
MRVMLEEAGYSVEEASSGQAGIDWLRDNEPGLVILDLMMPEVSGFDVLSHIRTEHSNPSLPVVVVTAKDLTQQDQAFLGMRYAEVVRKHVHLREKLLDHVFQALPGKST